MRTDRKLWKLILLTLVTFGIYPLFFWSKYAKDMNVVCEGDGKHTRGIAFRILISMLTFGIYDLVWMYGAGERIFTNSVRKNVPTTTTGGKVLAWYLLGTLIIIGPFVALHKLLEGLNQLCIDYNNRNGYIPGMEQSNGNQANAAAPAPNVNRQMNTGAQQAVNVNRQGNSAPQQAMNVNRQVTGRQNPVPPAPNAGAQQAAAAINGAMANAGRVARDAQQFVQNTVKSLDLDTENQLGMQWLPALPLISALCFLLGLITNLRARPSLFSVIAALILTMICYLKTAEIKPFSAVPFSIMAISMLQQGLWYLPGIGYMGLVGWLTLFFGLLTTAGAVVEWLLLFANPTFREQGVLIALGANGLMLVYYIIYLFSEGFRNFGSFMLSIGGILFCAAYLLLYYRSNFELLTRMTASAPASANASEEAAVPAGNQQPRTATRPGFEVDPMYQRMLNVPQMEVDVRSDAGRETDMQTQKIPTTPSAQPGATVACPSCGLRSPVETTVCPNCGSTLYVRRRRTTMS